MAKYVIDSSTLTDIANSIRAKKGTTARITPEDMPNEIKGIATGGMVETEPYKGEYVVTPKVEAQTMLTKEKVMLDNVTIEAIPYAEVKNNSNGKTVTIG